MKTIVIFESLGILVGATMLILVTIIAHSVTVAGENTFEFKNYAEICYLLLALFTVIMLIVFMLSPKIETGNT